MNTAEQRLLDKYGWRKVSAPKPWRPLAVGEELIGYYGGRTLRSGTYGQYEVVLVHVPYKGTVTVSGEMLIRLIDSAGIEKTHPIRVVWGGKQKLRNSDRKHNVFELFVADLEAVNEEDLPEVAS